MTHPDTSLNGAVKPDAINSNGGGAFLPAPAVPFSGIGIPALGGGGRSGDTRRASDLIRPCGSECNPAAGDTPTPPPLSAARCAGTTSAESAESHLLGSQRVEGPHLNQTEEDGLITVHPKL